MRFSEREKAFEDKFALDEEILFKVRARRNKQVGLWVAEKIGLKDNEAHNYADQLVIEMLDKDALLNRVRNDLQKAGLPINDQEIFSTLDNHVVEARKFFMEGSQA